MTTKMGRSIQESAKTSERGPVGTKRAYRAVLLAAVGTWVMLLLAACGGGAGDAAGSAPVEIEQFEASAGTFVINGGMFNNSVTSMHERVRSSPGVDYEVRLYLVPPGATVAVANGVEIADRFCLASDRCADEIEQECNATQIVPDLLTFNLRCGGQTAAALSVSGTYTVLMQACTLPTGTAAAACSEATSALPILLPFGAKSS